MTLLPRFRRIGITGSSLSGKSVFLLSLINHLERGQLDVSLNRKIPGGCVSRFRKLPLLGGTNRSEFPYDLLRHNLAVGKWPQRTTDHGFYRCRFQRPNSRLHGYDEIEFFDFPGERMADVIMFDADYEAWSDHVWASIVNAPEKKKFANNFLHLVQSDAPQPAKLVDAYKLVLAALINDCQPLISPSTFLLNQEGGRARGKSISEIAEGRLAGIQNAEFVPLPQDVRDRFPKLKAEFNGRYDLYKKTVVIPFQQHLSKCHRLVYLIDVADVLASGPMKLNDASDMVGALFSYLEPTRGMIPRTTRGAVNLLGSIVGRRLGCIDGIAFVASQADRVHQDDRDRLVSLIKDLVGNYPRNHGFHSLDYFYCAAVRSTRSTEKHGLVGRMANDSDVSEKQSTVPKVPEKWPHEWKAEDYKSFSNWHPRVSTVWNQPPEHLNLDVIMRFILK